jgi:hypothetical protein
MTSFLPIAINLPGTDVPGGALRSDRFHAGLKFVLAPFGSESSPVPTIFQMPALTGGTVATRKRNEANRGRGASLVDGRSRRRLSMARPNGIGTSTAGGPVSVPIPMISWLSAK